MPSEDEALQGLRTVLANPHAQWRNEGQKLAVMAGLQWQSDVVVVLPTGSGKSAIVATIAQVEVNRITAVLCPLRSLLQDWHRRLQALHIPHTLFDSAHPEINDQHSLVLVSLDLSTTHAWRQAVAKLRAEIPLCRIVIDEAHLVLTEGEYREVMSRVKELRLLKVQIMLLSATIAPISIPSLSTTFNLSSKVEIIRATSNRPELHFMPLEEMPCINTEVCIEYIYVVNMSNKNINRPLQKLQLKCYCLCSLSAVTLTVVHWSSCSVLQMAKLWPRL